jgi:hypothetical protein
MLILDDFGFLWTADMRLPVRLVDGRLQFFDKDKRRSDARGTPYVHVELDEIMRVVEKLKKRAII